MKCPDCKGKGSVTADHVTYANGKHGYSVLLKCGRCNSTGEVPDVMADWIRRGAALRDRRIAANRNLRDEAQRRGLTAQELSKMEFGKIEPVEPDDVLEGDSD